MQSKPARIAAFTLQGLLLCLCLYATGARAVIEPLDSIAAVVNDDIIMRSQVEKRLADVAQNIERQNLPKPPEDVLIRQVMEQLVLESIQLQIGERAGVRIDDNALNQTMQRVASQNNMSLSQFQQALAREGASYVDMREQIRKEMIINRVREGRVGQRIQITEQEIKNFLASDAGKEALQGGYRLAHLLIEVPETASDETRAALEQKANDLYQQLQNGADFAALAAQESDAPTAAAGGDLGWRMESQLPSVFSDVAPGMQVNEVSAPIATAAGFHIVKLLDKRGGDSILVPQSRVRHILIDTSEIRNDEQAKAFAAELRERIMGGEDFGALAKKYSADTGSLASGGELGWTTGAELVPSFRETMAAAELNVVSEPFRSRFGWHILEVIERRQHDMGAEIKRNRAREAIYQRKFDEELELWLREERTEAYVDVKIY